MIDLSNPTTMLNNINYTHNQQHIVSKKKPTKTTHVPTACINCKKAHLACDLSRPCKRCSTLGKSDTCIDIKHKKRGRPKLTASKKWQSSATNNTEIQQIPTTPTNGNFISLLPMAAPGLSACSFNMTLPNNNNNNKKPQVSADLLPQQPEMMTIFLSMDLCCARVSDESVEFLNIHPNNIDHCSFYDLIHSDSSETLSRIHRLLLDNSHSNRVPQQQPISFTTTASSDLFLTSSPAQLFQIANGSQTLRETLKFKSSGKSLSCRFYLGGGFGADLFVPSTLDHLYMVCIVSELNSITSASNIVKDIQRNNIIPTTPPSSLMMDSLLFNHEQQKQLDSILNTSDLISMYNTTPTADNETIQLVNHLCEAIMAPSSPLEEHTTKTGYHSSSDSSIGSHSSSYRFTSLDHETTTPPPQSSEVTAPGAFNILNDDMFMLSHPPKSTTPSKVLLLDDSWGYDIYA